MGCLETRFLEHKTARPGTSRALPIAAPAYGLCKEKSWATCWLKARSTAGLDAARQRTLIPGMAPDGWHEAAWTTPEFSAAFRTTLLQLGFSMSDLEGIGARSLKTTCLSWASKAGVPREHRRLLGYHVELGDKSVETYARDSLAAPLRSLDEVLEKIRAGKFDPDSTRSGFLKRGGEASEQTAASEKDSESSSTCPPSGDFDGFACGHRGRGSDHHPR